MSGPLQLLVDGEPASGTWPLDRGLAYGDGLFETMVVMDGRIRHEAAHRNRLTEGCRRLAIPADISRIWSETTAAAARHGTATLRLQVTRGESVTRGYTPTGRERARSFLAVYPPPSPGELPARIPVVSLDLRLGENPALAGLKHCNRLEQVLARQRLQQAAPGAFEGLLASSSGWLVSGTMSNVFLELDNELVTPELTLCGVAGVMRGVVLDEARAAGIRVRVAPVPFDGLAGCTALALTNARMGMVPVHELDGRALQAGALASLASKVNAT